MASDIPIRAELVRPLLPVRESSAHKWGVGGVLVLAGSPVYPGAAWLVCRAAGRAGAGIVTLATGRSVVGAIAGSLPEVAYALLPESVTPGGARRIVELLDEQLTKVKSMVIGPGLTTDETTHSLLGSVFGSARSAVRSPIGFGGHADNAEESEADSGTARSPFLHHDAVNVVLDADALNWLSSQQDWWDLIPAGRAVLTPHAGEFARLLDVSSEDVAKRGSALAKKAAATWKQTVVLKAGRTIVSDGTSVYVAERELPEFATGGSGDVLAGTIGGLLAQGLKPLDAAITAVYLGVQAANELRETFGETGIVATDIPDAIARAAAQLQSDEVH